MSCLKRFGIHPLPNICGFKELEAKVEGSRWYTAPLVHPAEQFISVETKRFSEARKLRVLDSARPPVQSE